jgi:hypothetical protein
MKQEKVNILDYFFQLKKIFHFSDICPKNGISTVHPHLCLPTLEQNVITGPSWTVEGYK